jgi:Beta-glucan synthesis-associated protein SKN1/KRE6/Sbg1
MLLSLSLFIVLAGLSYSDSSNIDGDTLDSYKTIRRYHDDALLKLVFSDEFNTDGRSFEPGQDKSWEAIMAPDFTNGTLNNRMFDTIFT